MILIHEKDDDGENQSNRQPPPPPEIPAEPELPASLPVPVVLTSTTTSESKRYSHIRRYVRRILRRCRRVILFVLCTMIIGYTLAVKVIPVLCTEYHRYQDDRAVYVPPGIAVDRCADWKSNPVNTEEFFVDMDALLFLAQGKLSIGEIVVRQSENTTWGDRVRVTVQARSTYPNFFEYVRVCQIRSRRVWLKDTGVGVFSVPWLPVDTGRFTVLVEIPVGAEDRLQLPSFRTDMPHFKHTFGNLSRVHFDKITVSTKARPINSEFLSFTEGTLRTSHAPIRGTYNASFDVSLTTSKSFIDVEMQLHRQEPTPSDTRLYRQLWTTSNLKASRGHIRATYDLRSSTPVAEHSRYSIQAETTLGEIDIDFADAPPKHVLCVHAATTFQRARVFLPPHFEGAFTMNSLYPFRTIEDNRESYGVDPLGRNRSRVLWHTYEGPFVRRGAIVRGRIDVIHGEIDLKSTLGSTAIVI
ncbi:hypothetical protein MD484_g2714, partial [Candolleomyces efflorescens]